MSFLIICNFVINFGLFVLAIIFCFSIRNNNIKTELKNKNITYRQDIRISGNKLIKYFIKSKLIKKNKIYNDMVVSITDMDDGNKIMIINDDQKYRIEVEQFYIE